MTMKIKADYGPLYNHATEAFYLAAEDTLVEAIQMAPYLTGQYAASLKIKRRARSKGPTATIGSTLPQAGALERGAWMKEGRGPHISRNRAPGTLKKAGATFGGHYESRLRRTPMRTAAIVTHPFGGERGLPELSLGVG